MNEILLFCEVVSIFSLLLLAKKFLGKIGVLAWIPIATIIANIITLKNANIFGMNTAIGSVVFASIFLATDILTECYGVKEAKQGVFLGFFGAVLFVISSQIALLYNPSEIDFVNNAMLQLFSINLRVTFSSLLMYFIANMADIFLYEKIKTKTKGKLMWLRNNISTISCNCLENFFFVIFGFYGLFDFSQCIHVAISISIIETIIGICDTPFLYLAIKIGGEQKKCPREVAQE